MSRPSRSRSPAGALLGLALLLLPALASPAQGASTQVTVLEGANVVDKVHNRAGGFEYTIQAKFRFSQDQNAYFKLVPSPDDQNAAYDNGTLSSDRKRALGGWTHHLLLLNETGGVLKYDAAGRPVNGDLGYTVDTTPTAPVKLEGGRVYTFRSVVAVPDKAGMPEGQRVLIRYHLVAADSQSRGGSGGAQDPAGSVEALLILHGEGTAGPIRGISLEVQGIKDGVVTNETLAATGKAKGAETVELLLNGDLVRALSMDAQGRFEVALILQEGPNTVQVLAKNRQGDKAQKTFQVFYQPVEAEVQLALPAWGGLGGASAELGLPWVVSAELLTNDPYANVTVTAREYVDRPGFLSKAPNGTGLRWFTLVARGIGPEETSARAIQEPARLHLRVPLAALAEAGIAPEAVSLFRWNGASWERVDATLTSKDGQYAYYTAEAAGLGEFALMAQALAGAVGGRAGAAPGDDAGKRPESGGGDGLLLAAIPALAAAGGAAAFLVRRRRRAPSGTSTLDAAGLGPAAAPPPPGIAATLAVSLAGPAGGPRPAVPVAGTFEHAVTEIATRLAQFQEGWEQDREHLATMTERLRALDEQLTSMERELGQRMARDRALGPPAGFGGHRQVPSGPNGSRGGAPFVPHPGGPLQPGVPGSTPLSYMPPSGPRGGR